MSGANPPRAVVVETSRSAYARLRPVPVDAVRLEDDFWAPRRRINREVSLPAQFAQLEETGRLANFRRAAGLEPGPHQGWFFNDSDVYKWLEAASWALVDGPDATLERMIATVIDLVAAAQEPSGYLNTWYQLGNGAGRWQELADTHELYCAGHLIQAGIAHQRVTGDERLLACARRFADHLCDVFGPAESGRRPGTDGHEEIELALVELWRATSERRYLDQAAYFLDARGHGLAGGDEYHQDHLPLREQPTLVGHAVRALYLMTGAADLYTESGEPALLATLERLWQDMTTRRMYVNGAVGSRWEGEAFGAEYELPNARAYTETCAAIASVMWNWRMLQLAGDARYADLLELALFNSVPPGVSLDGRDYFYRNPLASDGNDRRQPWYACACCPPNVARTLAALPGYLASVSDEGVWLHLYVASSARFTLPDGRVVGLRQRTRYPWDGDVELEVEGSGEFTLFLRVPAWCPAPSLAIDGEPSDTPLMPGSYLALYRQWTHGTRLTLRLPMGPRLVVAHPHVTENAGRRAVFRGPLLYCVEQAGNGGVDPRDVVLPERDGFTAADRDGMTMLIADAEVAPPAAGWHGRLYRVAEPGAGASGLRARVELIPYLAWANRAPGRMEVWLRSR